MVRGEGSRWDVGAKDNAVYVERISDSDERVFDDSLTADEARELAELLTKYADKVEESEDSEKSNDSDESEKSDKSDDSEKSAKSKDSDNSKDSDKSDDSEKSKDSDTSSD